MIADMVHMNSLAPEIRGFRAAERLFDLSSDRRHLFDTVDGLEPDELESFLDMVVRLLQEGIVGIETLEVNGQPYQSFITTRIAAPHLNGARPFRDGRGIRGFDTRA